MSMPSLHKIMIEGGVEMKDKKEFNVYIGQRIKQSRESVGYSQDKFAEMIGMGPKNVSAVERGVAGISVAALKRICETLCVSSDSLIMDEPVNIDIDKLNFLTERLQKLTPKQFKIALDINNKLFEAFLMQEHGSE